MLNRLFGFVLLAILISSWLGCYQPETGCLDIEAKNFTATADENCGGDDTQSNCPCTYPNLSLGNVVYVVDKATYEADNVYLLNSETVKLKSIQFYLSNFEFIRSDGNKLTVEDTISLIVLNEGNEAVTSILPDDFILVNEQSSIRIGAIKQSGQYDSLRFVVGISGQANTVLPNTVNNTSHPLASEAMHTGNQSEGYIFNQLIFQKDTLTTASVTTLNITGKDNLVEVVLPFSYKTPIGADFSIGTLQINHAKWFDGIKFVTDSDIVMKKKIVENTPHVFSLTE